MKCVVPIITASTPKFLSSEGSIACKEFFTPLVISSVVVVLDFLTICVPSINTESVLVPPTSIPMRIRQLQFNVNTLGKNDLVIYPKIYGGYF